MASRRRRQCSHASCRVPFGFSCCYTQLSLSRHVQCGATIDPKRNSKCCCQLSHNSCDIHFCGLCRNK